MTATPRKLFVSPLGNDRWSGRHPDANAAQTDGPVATLGEARDRLRAKRHRSRTIVEIRGGVYPLAEPLRFTAKDGGRKGAPVVYRAYRRETPVLDGGRAITGWEPVADDPAAVAPAARGKLWVAAIPKGWMFHQLYVNGREQPRSTSATDADWERWPRAPLGKREDELRCPPGTLPATDRAACAILNFLPTPYTFWSNALAPVRRVQADRGRLRFAPVQLHRPEVLKEIPFRLENLRSGITAPGQWFVDHRRGRVYLWPPHDQNPNDAWVAAPWLSSGVEVAGTANEPVCHLQLKGLTVVRTALPRLAWDRPQQAFGAAGAAVHLTGVEHCCVASCTLRHLSGNAVRMSGHARRNQIHDCTIAEIGGAGIGLGGGLKDPEAPCAHNRVTRNHIHHCGTLYWHSSAIAGGLSEKTVIRHNEIHDMPYVAISTSGQRHRWFAGWPRRREDLIAFWREHGQGDPTIVKVKAFLPGYNRIEFNRVERVMLRLDDGAAIYCHAGHHNVVRNNFVCCTPRDGSHGLYFDDEESFSLMEGNIVLRCPDRRHVKRGSALHIHNNAANTIRNNVFVGGDVLFTFPNSYGGHTVERNVFVFSNRCRLRSHPTPVVGPGDGRRQDGWSCGPSVMDGNLYWSSKGAGPAERLVAELRRLGHAEHALVVDPELGDLETTPRVAPGAGPLQAIGFQPIDLTAVGRGP